MVELQGDGEMKKGARVKNQGKTSNGCMTAVLRHLSSLCFLWQYGLCRPGPEELLGLQARGRREGMTPLKARQ